MRTSPLPYPTRCATAGCGYLGRRNDARSNAGSPKGNLQVSLKRKAPTPDPENRQIGCGETARRPGEPRRPDTRSDLEDAPDRAEPGATAEPSRPPRREPNRAAPSGVPAKCPRMRTRCPRRWPGHRCSADRPPGMVGVTHRGSARAARRSPCGRWPHRHVDDHAATTQDPPVMTQPQLVLGPPPSGSCSLTVVSVTVRPVRRSSRSAQAGTRRQLPTRKTGNPSRPAVAKYRRANA